MQGLSKKSLLVQTFQASNVPNLDGNLMQKVHPNWVSSCQRFDDANMVRVRFQSSTLPITHVYYFLIHIYDSQFLSSSRSHTETDVITVQLDAQKHLQIES